MTYREEEKGDIIEVDGRRFVRKVYEDEQKKYAAQARYDARMTERFALKLNKKTDADIISWIEDMKDGGYSAQGALKEAARIAISIGDAIDFIVDNPQTFRWHYLDQSLDSIEAMQRLCRDLKSKQKFAKTIKK